MKDIEDFYKQYLADKLSYEEFLLFIDNIVIKEYNNKQEEIKKAMDQETEKLGWK